MAPTYFFVVDAEGTRVSGEKLRGSGRWLWFNPGAIASSLSYRSSGLSWHTRETGRIAMARDGGIVFGVNDLGLLTIYAKDVGYMPSWQQRVWSGFNIAPDGGVCRELLASQAEGVPVSTLAPEAFLQKARDQMDEVFLSRFGHKVFRSHPGIREVLPSCHRFRALDRPGLFELAKDLARITADDIDLKQLQRIVPLDPGEKSRGSLKSLERVIAKLTNKESAATSMAALFATYELRLADAHLASSETAESLRKLCLDTSLPYVLQGRDMLVSLVDALFVLAAIVQSAVSGTSK